MIVRILLAIWDVAASCHCDPAGWRDTAHGLRCIEPRAHDRCAVDLSGWHEVQGIEFCSRGCGEEATTS